MVFRSLQCAAVFACVIASLAGTGCSRDEAEREYSAALRAANKGMAVSEQRRHLDRAIELAPDRSWYYESRALTWISECDFKRALADLDRAIELADRPYLRFLRGLVRCQSGQLETAIADFDMAIQAQPDNAQFFRGRSLARTELGAAGPALEDADRLLTLSPRAGTSYYARGRARAEAGDLEGAVDDLTLAHTMRPELAYTISARAEVYERLGESDLAAADRVLAAKMNDAGSPCDSWRDPFHY